MATNRKKKSHPKIREEQFRNTISQIRDYAIFTMDAEGKIQTWNEGCQHLLGYDEKEFIGMDAIRLFTPEQVASGVAHDELKTAAEKGSSSDDRWMMRKGDRRFWASGITTAVHDQHGQLIGFTKVMRDLTERQHAQEEAQRSIKRFQLFSDTARNLLEMHDPLELLDRTYDQLAAGYGLDFYFHFVLTDSNDSLRLRASRGIPPDTAKEIETLEFGQAVCGTVARELKPIALADVQRSQDPMTEFIRSLGITAYVCHPLMADGRLLGTLSYGTRQQPCLPPDLLQIISTLADLIATAVGRKQSEDALEASEARFRLTFESAPNGTLMTNEQGIITMVNAHMEQLFGYDRTEMIGQPVDMLLPVRNRPPQPGQAHAFFSPSQAPAAGHGRELLAQSKDGTEFPVEIGSNQVETPDGKFILAAVTHIGERKRMEAQLAEAHAKLTRYAQNLESTVEERTAHLQETIAELEGVSYSLSHDMRAPLRTIHSFSQIILEDADERLEPNEKDILAKVISAAGRLDRLIQDVLIYSRVSREAVKLRPVDVEDLLRQIIYERPEFQSPQADITIESPLEPVQAHEAYLTQCITNLLDNAVKFVPQDKHPKIRIRNDVTGDTVRLWFEDNGIGIPEDAQGRLFGIFQRLHSEQSFPGTGIGLAIVRKAVERMNGTAGLQSTPDQGSRFWVELPRAT